MIWKTRVKSKIWNPSLYCGYFQMVPSHVSTCRRDFLILSVDVVFVLLDFVVSAPLVRTISLYFWCILLLLLDIFAQLVVILINFRHFIFHNYSIPHFCVILLKSLYYSFAVPHIYKGVTKKNGIIFKKLFTFKLS